MLKILSKSKYDFLIKDYNIIKKDLKEAKTHAHNLSLQLEMKEEKIDKLIEELEAEKDKYKKYMKQSQKKYNDAKKKWLNGYPDE